MNLEHCRKDAKRLLRAVVAEEPEGLARVNAVLGDRGARRLGLSDAQHVVAVEHGYRSWPALARDARRAAVLGPVESADSETLFAPGLEYLPGVPVRVWVRHRPYRTWVSDHGSALEHARSPRGWRRACAGVHAELDVNITRAGVVTLPIVPAGPPEGEVARRVARASLIFFQELLELEDG